jgi:hypothetical protein
MQRKTHNHSCRIDGYSKKGSAGKNVSPLHTGVKKSEVVKIFNRFYRDQVNDLYRAVKNID